MQCPDQEQPAWHVGVEVVAVEVVVVVEVVEQSSSVWLEGTPGYHTDVISQRRRMKWDI